MHFLNHSSRIGREAQARKEREATPSDSQRSQTTETESCLRPLGLCVWPGSVVILLLVLPCNRRHGLPLGSSREIDRFTFFLWYFGMGYLGATTCDYGVGTGARWSEGGNMRSLISSEEVWVKHGRIKPPGSGRKSNTLHYGGESRLAVPFAKSILPLSRFLFSCAWIGMIRQEVCFYFLSVYYAEGMFLNRVAIANTTVVPKIPFGETLVKSQETWHIPSTAQ